MRHGDFKGPIEIQTGLAAARVFPKERHGDDSRRTKTKPRSAFRPTTKRPPASYKIAMNASTTGGDAFSGSGRIRVSQRLRRSQAGRAVPQPSTCSAPRWSAASAAEMVGHAQAERSPSQARRRSSCSNCRRGVKMLEPAPRSPPRTRKWSSESKADPDALLGLYKDITCEVTFNGERPDHPPANRRRASCASTPPER